ncbi:MAG: YceI family protein, partial [Bryobacteraceae bacterium]
PIQRFIQTFRESAASAIAVYWVTEAIVKKTICFATLTALLVFTTLATAQTQSPAGVPVFKVSPVSSKITFHVDASSKIDGTFNKWDASLTFASTEVSTAVLDIEIQAASVDTGSGIKNKTLEGKDFFDVDKDPLITFKSTKVVQNGPNTFEVDGNFTIRGVTKPEKLSVVMSGKGTGSGSITGTMAFDRKDYGMNSGIPFMKIANRVEVSVDLKGNRISGPPPSFKQ